MNKQDFAQQASANTLESYEVWHELLVRWNKKINLVSGITLADFWARHALDSYQITMLIPKTAKTVLDMGSGAGFPGLAAAIAMQERGEGSVFLAESKGKKCNFLRAVIRALDLPASAMQCRVESLPQKQYDMITARAFAPLDKLLAHSAPMMHKDTILVFPKGARYKEEIEAAKKVYDFEIDVINSLTDEDAKILRIKSVKPRL